MVVMDEFTCRIIGFAVQPGSVDGAGPVSLRKRAAARQLPAATYVSVLVRAPDVCELCGANSVLGDRVKYVCSSYSHGRACANDVRLQRDTAEAIVLARFGINCGN